MHMYMYNCIIILLAYAPTHATPTQHPPSPCTTLPGGYDKKAAISCKRTALSALISQLLESCLLTSRTSPIQWQSLSIPYVSNFNSPAASLGGCFLVVGGATATTLLPEPKDISSSIHAYCPSSSSWFLVGELTQPCYYCTTATLPSC